MEKTAALDSLSALAQPTRLDVFRLLMQAGPATGMAAGDISSALGIRANTLSANLSVLLAAGLVRKRRNGRSIRYFPETDQMRELLTFLMEDCCGGNPDLCAPFSARTTAEAAPCDKDKEA
ncbi:transcriptional regulator [Meridianimarinicoccus roseus]|jgi:DNA-binding transcriptional ArsR family regulator|uniref:Transcriptional regulator n=1 Tax=Meridianimarinicoccus roseus TaxID=2072018 RepID=A0A2V2LGU6_9RHOB|nr:metalloregulator ArsR/SmtB family transcription factor [Meridianimarinicoccus roseus]PWR02476.1 transcriptional regulator [Meridianimarinicoccus roseus]